MSRPMCPACGLRKLRARERWLLETDTDYSSLAFKEEANEAGRLVRKVYVDDESSLQKRVNKQVELSIYCRFCQYTLPVDELEVADWLESDPIPLEEQMEMFPNPEARVEGEWKVEVRYDREGHMYLMSEKDS